MTLVTSILYLGKYYYLIGWEGCLHKAYYQCVMRLMYTYACVQVTQLLYLISMYKYNINLQGLFTTLWQWKCAPTFREPFFVEVPHPPSIGHLCLFYFLLGAPKMGGSAPPIFHAASSVILDYRSELLGLNTSSCKYYCTRVFKPILNTFIVGIATDTPP